VSGTMILPARRAALSGALCATLLVSGCYNSYTPKAADIPADVSGEWCSPDGDVLTLEPDGNFDVRALSKAFAEYLLPADGYVDDYRIKTELGGKVPSTASGTWKVHLTGDDPTDAHDNSILLTLKKVGAHPETDIAALYFDGDDNQEWGFATLPKSEFIRYFDRCAHDPKSSTQPS